MRASHGASHGHRGRCPSAAGRSAHTTARSPDPRARSVAPPQGGFTLRAANGRDRTPSSLLVLVTVAVALVAAQDVHTRVAGRRRTGGVDDHWPFSSSSSSSMGTLRDCSHCAPHKRRYVTKL